MRWLRFHGKWPAASTLSFVVLAMLSSVAQVLSNTLGTALVLSTGGPDRLPVLYMALAGTSVPFAFGLSTLIDRRSPLRLYQWLLGVSALLLVVLWLAVTGELPFAGDGVYMTAKLHEILGDILFWVLVSQYFTSLEVKRVATLLGLSFALGGLCSGGLTALLLEVLPVTALLLLIPAVYALQILQLAFIERRLEPLGSGSEEEDDEAEISLLGTLRSLPTIFRRYPMALWISASVFLMIVSYCVVEYLFYSVYVANYPDETELTAFLALMNGVLQAAEMFFLAAIATPLMARGGPVLRNLFLPVVNLLCLGALLLGFRLPAAIATQVSGDALNNAVFEPVKAVNFAAVPHRYAGRIRTVTDGIVFPLGLATAGLGLLLLLEFGLSLTEIGLVAFVLSGLFVVAAWRTGRTYLPQLVKNLSSGSVNFDGQAPLAGNAQELASQVAGLLASPDREAHLFGLRLAARPGQAVPLEQVVAAVRGDDAEVRRAAVGALAAMPAQSQRQFLSSALAVAQEAETAAEEAVALRTVAMGLLLTPHAAVDEDLRKHGAQHPDHAVRVAALAAGLFAGAKSDGRADGETLLLSQFMTLDPAARSRVLEAISAAAGAEGALEFCTPLLLTLAESPEAAIRVEALSALAQFEGQDEAISEAGLKAMDDEMAQVRTVAAGLLASAGGGAAAGRLALALGDEARSVRHAAAHALARCGPRGEVAARAALADGNPDAVEAAALALGQMATRSARHALFGALQPIYRRLAANRRLKQLLAPLGDDAAARALAIALADSDRRALEQVLQVLEALSRDRTVSLLRRALDAGDRRGRADAVEALASLPDRRFVAPLMPLLSGLAASPDRVQTVNAETAAQGLREAIRLAAADDDRWVGRTGRWLLAQRDGATEIRKEGWGMDRLLFLKSVSLFRGIPFDDLLALNAAMVPADCLAGETVIADGSVGHSMFLVLEGNLAVRKGDRTLAELGPADCFGEMALIDAAPRAADVVAVTDSRLLRIGRAAFESLTEEHPRVLAELCRLFVRRLRQAAVDPALAVAAATNPSAPRD